jgi:hypothetical protein
MKSHGIYFSTDLAFESYCMYLHSMSNALYFYGNKLINQLLIIINWCCVQLAVLAVKCVRLQQHVEHVPLGIMRVDQIAYVSDVYHI